MTREEIELWLLDNRLLFPPSNKRPTREEAEMIFRIANELDKTQTHRMTSCGRCYGNAKRVIEKSFAIF